jgi:hypothetical protein
VCTVYLQFRMYTRSTCLSVYGWLTV